MQKVRACITTTITENRRPNQVKTKRGEKNEGYERTAKEMRIYEDMRQEKTVWKFTKPKRVRGGG